MDRSTQGVSGFFTNLLKKVTFSTGIPTGQGRSRGVSIGSERSASPPVSEDSLNDNYVSADNRVYQRADSFDGPNGWGLESIVSTRSESYPIIFGSKFTSRNCFGLSRDFWMRDEAVQDCYDCKAAFGTFRRKHHCRICGQIFCHKCASNIVNGARFGYVEDLRVCDYCLRVTTDFSANEAATLDVPVIVGSPLHSQGGHAFVDSGQAASKRAGIAPFRKENDDMDDDLDLRPYSPEELYSSFSVNQSHADIISSTPRSFVKLSPDRSAFLDHEFQFRPRSSSLSMERKKSPALSNRRKYSKKYGSGRIAQIFPFEIAPTTAESFEMNLASVNHINLLIHQMLLKSRITRTEEWKTVILSMILKACSKLNPNVREGDEIDIRHYVKIKKIPGGDIADSHYLNGVVASKKVIHKQMLKPMHRAKILLLTFPLEYQRVENQFISLATLIAQERDHLKNLVGRLIALQPDIVMVEKTVARLALEFLLDANIFVIPNVKISLLSAVSRTTGADIVHSIDQLAAAKIGSCQSFEFKTYIHSLIPGCRKTYLYVEGIGDLGCTIVLRGASMEELILIKDIVDFLVFAIYNLKLETSLFQDEYAMNPNVEEITESTYSPLSVKSNPYDRAIYLYKNVILASSPNVRFPIPFLLANRSKAAQENTNVPTTEVMEDSHIPLLLNAERMSPISHQNIIVLYSNNSPSTIIPCATPRPHLIEYYRESDLSLGQFIEDTCLGSQLPCIVCEKPALVHYRTYSHGSGKVTVTVNPLPCPVSGMEGRIVMWSLCRICKESTPFIPMSETTWKYSFGKYLELTFYHKHLHSRTHSCEHDVHRDHMRYFSFQNLAVRFEFEEIVLFDISGPPMNRTPKAESISKWRQQDAEAIKKQVTDYYTSVLDRIQNFTYEIVSTSKLAVCKEAMNELSKRAAMEKKLLLQLLHQTLIESSPADCLSLNRVYKSLLANVLQWDQDFLAFIRNYLSTDVNEMRRKTAAQIKRIFVDMESSSVDNRVSFIPQSIESAPKAGDAGEADHFGFPLGVKVKLPTLEPELEDFHFFTSDTHRRMSLECMASSSTQIPVLGSSPSIYRDVIPFSSLSLATRMTAFSENNDEVVSSGSMSTYEPSLKVHEIKTKSSDIRPTQSMPKSIRFEEHTSSSMQNLEKMQFSEEDISPEWNTITCVAGQNEKEENLHFDTNSEVRPTSIMKTITNLWTGNPGNFLPLVYPSNPVEHLFPDSNIIVRETEPSSIISFALSSSHYIEKLQGMRNGIDPDVTVDSLPVNDTSAQQISIDLEDNNQADIEESLLRETGTHIRYQFWDGSTKLHCKIYFAEQFDALRRNCGISGIYEHSLARCVKWDASGGKSGTFFLKTKDDWLVCKKLSPVELEALISFSPAYFEYMSQAFFHELPTVLVKIYGFYHIGFKNPVTRKTVKMDILVMENLFYDREKLSTIFDLKGSVRNRHVHSTGKQNEVLLDKNLLELIFDNPLFIREHSKKILRASVYNDTLFLSKLNVMDYSLLVGIDNEKKELVIGIVDFIRTFTWDKKLESWVKETGLLGGGKEPTIVTPRQYKNRFREAMESYFLMVPDKFVIAGNIPKDDEEPS